MFFATPPAPPEVIHVESPLDSLDLSDVEISDGGQDILIEEDAAEISPSEEGLRRRPGADSKAPPVVAAKYAEIQPVIPSKPKALAKRTIAVQDSEIQPILPREPRSLAKRTVAVQDSKAQPVVSTVSKSLLKSTAAV